MSVSEKIKETVTYPLMLLRLLSKIHILHIPKYRCLFSENERFSAVLAMARKNETGLRSDITDYQESFPINFILRRLIFYVPGLGDIAKVEL